MKPELKKPLILNPKVSKEALEYALQILKLSVRLIEAQADAERTAERKQ